jgi:hypothetical protein
MTFAEKIIDFYTNLQIHEKLPDGIQVMNPYKNNAVIEVCKKFYNKYYNDSDGRILILGINPGRFGAGVTGIPFTDPIRLETVCGIENNFDKKPELSSEFIYKMIAKFGSAASFYKHYYIGAVSPLGFIKNGRNFNYYDSKELFRVVKPFIINSLIEQISLGIISKKCFVLGQGKNYDYVKLLNMQLKVFDEIIPLPHPRWIMQYKRKELDEHIVNTVTKLIS